MREASGLTWSVSADAIRLGRTQMHMWRKADVESAGGAMYSLFRFASLIKDGLNVLIRDGFQMDL